MNATRVDTRLWRLRPGASYSAEVWGRVEGDAGNATMLLATTFEAATTGYAIFDEGALATIGGAGTPSYQFLVFDLLHSASSFEGVVGVDREGYVVWYHDVGDQVLAFDQFADYDVVLNTLAGTSSTLAVVTAAGEHVARYDDACDGFGDDRSAVSAWSQVNHEARVHTGGTGEKKVLTNYQTASSVRSELDDGASAPEYLGATLDNYLNDHVATWNVKSGKFETLVDVELNWNPVDYFVEYANSMTYEELVCPEFDDTAWALDWSHLSAVSEDDENYVVSLRNLNVVAAFSKRATDANVSSDVHKVAPAWTLSCTPEISSTFAWTDYETDCFYDVHSAEITSKGTLLLFDDGNNRNHCSADDGTTNATGCFSRAIEYSLDFREQTVTVVWQFEWEKLYGGEGSLVALEREDLFVHDGGSVTYVDRASDSNDDPYSRDGLYYVAFTVTERDSDYAAYAWIFEVDAAGQVVSEVLVPRDLWDGDKPGSTARRRTTRSAASSARRRSTRTCGPPPGDGEGGGRRSHPPRMAAVVVKEGRTIRCRD